MTLSLFTDYSFTGYAFQEHYWMHVEYFPMHNEYIDRSAIRDLVSILKHARGGEDLDIIGDN